MPIFLIPIAAAGYVYFEKKKKEKEAEERNLALKETDDDQQVTDNLVPEMKLSQMSVDSVEEEMQDKENDKETQSSCQDEPVGLFAGLRKALREHAEAANARDQGYCVETREDGSPAIVLPKISYK